VRAEDGGLPASGGTEGGRRKAEDGRRRIEDGGQKAGGRVVLIKDCLTKPNNVV